MTPSRSSPEVWVWSTKTRPATISILYGAAGSPVCSIEYFGSASPMPSPSGGMASVGQSSCRAKRTRNLAVREFKRASGRRVRAEAELPVLRQGGVDRLDRAHRLVDQRGRRAVRHVNGRRIGAEAQERDFENRIGRHAVLFPALRRARVRLQVGNQFGGADAVLHRAVGDPGVAVSGGMRQRVGQWRDIGAHMDRVPDQNDGRLAHLKRRLQRQRGGVRNRCLVVLMKACGQGQHGTQAETRERDLHGASPLRSRIRSGRALRQANRSTDTLLPQPATPQRSISMPTGHGRSPSARAG